MRNTAPWIFLIAGLATTGYFAREYAATSIQSDISAHVKQAVPEGTRHNAKIDVSGRDITVSGLLHDTAEHDALIKTLSELRGNRVVRTDDITFLPVAAPFQGTVTKGPNGTTVETVLPDEKIASQIGRSFQGNADMKHALASGMPDDEWPAQLVAMASVLSHMENGSATLEGTKITLSGRASTRAAQQRFENFENTLPAGYSLNMASVDYPEPYNITLNKSPDGTVSFSGLAPKETQASAISDVLNISEYDAANLENTADGDLSEVVEKLTQVAPVLALMKSYDVTFKQLPEASVVVTGAVLPNVDLEEFAAIRSAAKLDAADLQMPRPFDVQFSLDAVKGAQLVGLAPEGFDPEQLAANLGIPKINTDKFEIGARGDSAELSDQISGLKPVLEDVETLEVGLESATDQGPQVKAETLPNADPERVANLLKDVFVTLTEVDVAPTKNVYVDGQQRINGITGVKEQYQAGYWVPLVTVTDPTIAGCKVITDAILKDRQIAFKSAVAKLDPSARVVINRLAGVIISCFDQTPLKVELSGHTDSQGFDADNLLLSIERVNTVRDALATRGVDLLRMLAVGYGETQPIADNETAEGRRANRRTEFEWLN